jgi:hypothetical protein
MEGQVAEHVHPGVFVEETLTGANLIEVASTFTACFAETG